MSLLELFCDVDDFCEDYQKWLSKKELKSKKPHQTKKPSINWDIEPDLAVLF